MEKLPPIEKIHEAYSAIADNRVEMQDNKAIVQSSNGEKEYIVVWEEERYSSNDSATYWQLYAGYPIIAVLMLQNKLPFNDTAANHFVGINWTELNKKYKRNYAKAVSEVMDGLKQKDIDTQFIEEEIENVYESLKHLQITIKRGSNRPPK